MPPPGGIAKLMRLQKEAKPMDEQAIAELEKFVDTHGLRKTLAILASVCADKIEHLHDIESANNWNRAYRIILKAHDALPL